MNEETSEPVKHEKPAAGEKTGRPEFNLATDTITEAESSDNSSKLDAGNQTQQNLSEISEPEQEKQQEVLAVKDSEVQAEEEDQPTESKQDELLAKMAELQKKKQGLGNSSTEEIKAEPESISLDYGDDDLPNASQIGNEHDREAGRTPSRSVSEPVSANGTDAIESTRETVEAFTDATIFYNFNDSDLENKPEFPGGDMKMWEYIESNKRHPENMKSEGVGGEVFVSFVINEKGKVTNVEILTSTVGSSKLENDAKRVIKSMPTWSPGKMDGNPVKVRKTMMVKYPLE